MDKIRRLYTRFRTFQLRHFGSWGGLRLGLPVWCTELPPSYYPGYRAAGEIEFLPTVHTPGTVGVRVFRDTPLGNDVVTAYMPLSKIEYRWPRE